MCSACTIMRPRSSKSAVEQSRRSLMFAENEERTRTAPISSAIERSAKPRSWSSIFTIWSRSREDECGTIPNPHPPGGDPAGGARQLDDLRPLHPQRLGGRELERWPRPHLGGPHRDELDRPLTVGVAVALLVRAVEGLRQPRLERHGQLERLAGVAKVGLA